MASEFDFIHYIKKSFGLNAIGDDCAILPKNDVCDTVITADLLVEDVDFRLGWTDGYSLGHKALAVSLSDIAAMGAKPEWALLTLAVPERLWDSDFVKDFYEGWHSLSRIYNCQLVGGDISRSPDRLVADSIVGGDVPRGAAVLRSGAKPGDGVFVSGRLGGASGGLRLLERTASYREDDSDVCRLIDRQLRPKPRVELGEYLRTANIASAMIDISDGLSSDIHHICVESHVGAVIQSDLVPVDESLVAVFGKNESFAMALNGGEDFELLFTANEEKISVLRNEDVTRIGTITEHSGTVELIDGDTRSKLYSSGYRHF
jgi:thiamine-monophosphate kinase